jgi:hypothetical protein
LGKYNPVGVDIITGEMVDLSKQDLVATPLSAMIVKLGK